MLRFLPSSPMYPEEKRREDIDGMWGAALFYRPISLVVTPWFIAASVSPNTVTLASFLLVLSFPLFSFLPPGSGAVTLGATAVLFGILDCVDGNVARATGRTSDLGHYADFITDVVFRIVLYMTIGVLAQKMIAPDDPRALGLIIDHAVLLSGAAAVLAITARLCRVYYELRLEPRGESADRSDADTQPATLIQRLYGWAFSFVSGLDPLTPVLTLVAGFAGRLDWLIAWLLGYSVLDFMATQISILLKLRSRIAR